MTKYPKYGISSTVYLIYHYSGKPQRRKRMKREKVLRKLLKLLTQIAIFAGALLALIDRLLG